MEKKINNSVKYETKAKMGRGVHNILALGKLTFWDGLFLGSTHAAIPLTP